MRHYKTIASPWLLTALGLLITGSLAGAGELRGRVAGATGTEPAVVWIEGITGEVPKTDTVLTHVRGGAFAPHVAIGFVGNEYVLQNEDDTMHNIHLHMRLGYQKAISDRPLELGATLYNIALPKAGAEVRRPIKPYHRYRDDTGFIEAFCDRHPQETAYVLVFDHPYAALTAADGTFDIHHVAPGNHLVRLWQGGAVKDWKRIEVKDGAPTEVVIE